MLRPYPQSDHRRTQSGPATTRDELLAGLEEHLVDIASDRVLRVAIDGVDAAGKTTLANELAGCIERLGRPVIRASIDSFHNPRSIRCRLGALSPEGYYRDSFNLPALIEALLAPLAPGGTGFYRTGVFDHQRDTGLNAPLLKAELGSILLFDGIFLVRRELRCYWDFSIFVRADFDVTLRRAVARDLPFFGSVEQIERRYRRRYIPGQMIYLQESEPESSADLVIDYNDPFCPLLIANGPN
jgi:uridine kinase